MTPPLSAQLLTLLVGDVRSHGADEFSHKPWETGFYKAPVEGALWLAHPSSDGTRAGLPGDAQADLKYHGGPEKAVCVYPSEHYEFWREELGIDQLPFGAFGENFTIAGLTEAEICIGDIFRVGDGPDAAQVQVSQLRQPCWKLARRWNRKEFPLRMQQNGKTGWYFRVIQEGNVTSGQTLSLLSRPHPEWPLSIANQIMHHRKHDLEVAAQLAACPALSVSWKKTLNERAERGDKLDTSVRLDGKS